MPSIIRRHQHELLAPGESTGFVFGTEDTGYLTLTRPTITAGEQANADSTRAQEDGGVFGRDYRGAKTFGFEIGVLTDADNGFGSDPEAANLDALARIDALWNHPRWRNTPSAHAILRTNEAGRTSRCYGRPRRYDESASGMTADGYTPVVCDFQLWDDRWYADEESSATVTVIASTEGGFVAPLVAPITTIAPTTNEGVATVGGLTSTWPVITFTGPSSGTLRAPSVQIGALTIGLSATIPPGESVTIDPRPWRRGVTRASDGASLAGYYVGPRLATLQVEPGTYKVTLRGSDPTGTAQATVRWRDARSRP